MAEALNGWFPRVGPPDLARHERFTRVYEEHFRAVSAYVLRRTTPAEADDAVAETFLVAWRRLDELPEKPKPWLLGIARRVLANQRRAAGRRRALTERVGGAMTDERGRAGRPTVLQALAHLPEKDRELLLLIAWDGLSIWEAAAVLRCSATAAKVRLHRARSRFRAQLQRFEGGRAGASATRRLEECHEE